MQKEVFDIITSPRGSSYFSIPLSCVSVKLHYRQTTGATGRNSEKCSTGLRVYEGAEVLSAFVFQYLTVLLGSLPPASGFEQAVVIELGCGCGLAGFCAAQCIKKSGESLKVVFTDASSDCLALVRSSGVLQSLNILSLSEASPSGSDVSSRKLEAPVHGFTFPLFWGNEEMKRDLHCRLNNFFAFTGVPESKADGRYRIQVPLILCSDIMYYRSDIQSLLSTISSLLTGFSAEVDKNGHDAEEKSNSSFAVLSHFMRIPNGREQLLNACQVFDLGIVKVNLSACLDFQVVSSRGWGGLEVVLLFLKGKRRKKGLKNDEQLKSWGEQVEDEDVIHAQCILQKRIQVFHLFERIQDEQLGNKLLHCIEPYALDAPEEHFIWPDL